MNQTQKFFSIEGHTALVTGCSRGIGRAMAVGLAEAGADIIGVSNSLAPGSDTEKQVVATSRKFFGYATNLGDRTALYEFISKVKQEHKQIDILVNNAGTIMRKPAAEHPDEYWDPVLNINLDAPFILTRELGKEMIARGRGINVPGYAASKGAIASLVKAFANEWASNGVNVNGIAPGYIATDNTEALRNDAQRSKSILDRIPANRWGEPDDFKGPIVFLCSDAAAYVHGTIVTVDGGWMGR
jgi:2-deoxy-D-gluconate 3-dehydrogenase